MKLIYRIKILFWKVFINEITWYSQHELSNFQVEKFTRMANIKIARLRKKI